MEPWTENSTTSSPVNDLGARKIVATACDLNIGAHYRINDMWGVFLRGENILNHRYYIGPAVPSQGIRCLAGATVRF